MKIVEGGVLEETKQIIKNILGVLEENNLTLANVVKTTIFITDIRDFAEVNKIYGEFFTHKPARTTVEVSALPL
jgi:2-iminobutanoate/2-iminopropanoate deaminase